MLEDRSEISFDDALNELSADVGEAKERLLAKDNQFNRRTYIRTFFAFLEGFAYAVRRATIDLMHVNALKHDKLNIDRLFLLREETPTLGHTGKIDLQPQQLPFLPHFAFTLRAFAEEQDFEPDFFGDNGWNDLQKAVKIRNRLTHPKKTADCHVSNDDLRTCVNAADWFQKRVMAQLKAHHEARKAS